MPGHHVRLFCASLVCASRIGKDLYVEFDPATGLVLRALNDAKSAYVCFRFQPHFFQRCTSSEWPSFSDNARVSSNHHNGRSPGSSSVATGRSPSSSQAGQEHDHTPRSSDPSPSPTTNTPATPGSASTQSSYPLHSSQSNKFICRVSLRALAVVVRQRKNTFSLRVRSEQTSHRLGNSNSNRGDNDREESDEGGTLCLSFEFLWETPPVAVVPTITNRANGGSSSMLRVLHRVPVASVTGIRAALASRESASEIHAHPSVLWRLLDPLKRTAEAALIVRRDIMRIHASSFHQSTADRSSKNNQHSPSASGNNHALLQNSDSLLKTETGIACDDLDEFFFVEDRSVEMGLDVEGGDNEHEGERMPKDVNDHVILVFSIKEVKAFLLFATSACSNNHSNNSEPGVSVYFHWGGKPMVWEIQPEQSSLETTRTTSSWKGELILATLEHDLLGSALEINNMNTTSVVKN